MENETKTAESVSANTGNSAETGKANGDPLANGKSTSVNKDEYVEKKSYLEAQKKITDQGQELGQYRDWFNRMSPFLEKVQDNPEIIDAILNDKINSELTQAIIEGKIKIEDAKMVTEANENVKKEMGSKNYSDATPEEIEKRINETVSKKIEEARNEFDGKISKQKIELEKKEFEDSTNKFIEKTTDYSEYAEKIWEYIDEHPNETRIDVVYDIVRGRHLAKKKSEDEEAKKRENNKDIASSIGGGSASNVDVNSPEFIDKLIAKRSNPNYF